MRRDFSRLGPGRASWNHRMQTGGPSPAPVQRAPRSPARAGRADTQTACRLRATNSARRNRTRSVSRRHRLTSLTMSGMDAVNQIRSAPSKAFRFMQTNRGVARRDGRCAQARTRFTPLQRFAKEKLCLSIKAFYAVRIFSGLHVGGRIAQRVAEVARIEQSEIRDRAVRPAPDFVSLNPGYACLLSS